jgi:short-subunit dehydrogenase
LEAPIKNQIFADMENNNNLSVVITGASSGIGRATAMEFARKGHKIALAARRMEKLEEVANECRRVGGEAYTYALDVSKEEQVYDFARYANEKMGCIDVWVNNAAVAMMGPFDETPMENIKRLLDVNLLGYMYGSRAALSYFRNQGRGTLINLSSVVGTNGQPFSIAYTTSKAAIRGMTLCLQQELAQEKNINVCLVSPATVDTPLFQNAANYMGREVKAMEPVIDAQSVAEEIVSLVRHPKPEVLVGGMALSATLMKHLSPDGFARMYNKQVQSKHFKEDMSAPNPGNLFEPGELASIDGGWLNGQASRAVKGQVRNSFLLGLIVAAAVAGTATVILSRKSE